MYKIEGAIGYSQIMSSQQSPPLAQRLMCGKMHCKQGLHTVNYNNTSSGACDLNDENGFATDAAQDSNDNTHANNIHYHW